VREIRDYLCTITAARTLFQLPVHYYCCKKDSLPITCALLLPHEGLSSNQLPVYYYHRKKYYPPIICALLLPQGLSSSYLCTITTARRTLLQLPVYYYRRKKDSSPITCANYCRKKDSSPITCAILLPQEGISCNYLRTITAARRTLLQLPVKYYCRKKDSPPIIQLSNRRPKQAASRLKDMCCRKHIHSFEDSRLPGCYRIDW